jgi:hypothetical protein
MERRRKRGRTLDADGSGVPLGLTGIDGAIAIIEAISARIDAHDFRAVDSLFAGQAVALDAMFNHLAKASPCEDVLLALRAQQQCRATLKSLLALKTPRANRPVVRSAQSEGGNSTKRTIEPADSPGLVLPTSEREAGPVRRSAEREAG